MEKLKNLSQSPTKMEMSKLSDVPLMMVSNNVEAYRNRMVDESESVV